MKNTRIVIKILLMGIFVFSVIACNDDFLETKPLTEYSEVDVWEGEDPGLMLSFLADIYLDVEHGYEKYPPAIYVDESDARAYTSALNVNNGADSPTTGGYWNQWQGKYKQIRNINIALENIDRSPIEEELKNRIKGELHFLMAMYYHHLVRLYGGVPIIEKTFKLNDDFLVPRNTFSECIEFVVDHCDKAAALLPLENSGSDQGRGTKGAALALKSRVLLHAASDLHHRISQIFPGYGNPELIGYTSGNQAERWQAAKTAAKAVIDINKYSLYKAVPAANDNISQNYIDQFLSYNNEEDIFIRYFTPEWWQGVNTCPLQLWFPNGFGGRGNNAPLGNLVDDFEMTDGTPFDWNNPEHAAAPYQNRDPRFHAFVIYEGSFVRDIGREESLLARDPTSTLQVGSFEKWDPVNNKVVIEWGLDTRKSGVRQNEACFTGYYLRKFMDHRIDGWFYAQDIPWRYMRYAEIIFNYAEACIELGQEDEARNYLNMIRKKAGMPEITESGSALKERFRNEKRIEMAFEDQRYYDVRRWAIGAEAYGPCYAADVVYKLREDKTTSSVPIIKHKVFQTRSWKNKMYFKPVFYNEILRNELLIQNPEY